MLQVVALLERRFQEGQPFRRRHEHAGIAIAQDVTDLVRLQQRIDGDKHAACTRRAKCRNDRLRTLVEKNGDAFGTRQLQCHESAGKCGDTVGQCAVLKRLAAIGQCSAAGAANGRCLDKFVQEIR